MSENAQSREMSLAVMWNNNCGSLLNQGVTSLRTTGVRVTASRTLRYLRTRGVGGRVLKALDKVVQSPEWDNSYKLVSDDGTVPGRRPHATNDFSIKIPIEDLAAGGVPDGIAVIHTRLLCANSSGHHPTAAKYPFKTFLVSVDNDRC
ncbi:hypothetical protein ACVII1_002999 [Bradyrhizobium elkanii]